MELPGTQQLLLEIDLTAPPADPPAGDPLARLAARGRPQRGALLRALHEAGEDRRVVGLVAKVGGALPWAVAQELRLGRGGLRRERQADGGLGGELRPGGERPAGLRARQRVRRGLAAAQRRT